MNELNNPQHETDSGSMKEYLGIIRNNLLAVVMITLSCLVVALVYAVNSKNIFKATTSLKVTKPQGSILESPLMPEFQEFGSDRFIANEIEILKSYNIRERVAKAIVDSSVNYDLDSFYLILDQEFLSSTSKNEIIPIDAIVKLLEKKVTIEQRRGLDIVEISVESPSPFEASLVANCYGKEYRNLNLEINRNQLTVVKSFLASQKSEKLEQLNTAEEVLREFQEKGGVVALDVQASSLINQLTSFEAQKNAVQIELFASDKVLKELKNEMERQNPRLADYLESFASEAYFKSLQEQLAKLELNRDLAEAKNDTRVDNTALINDYNRKINELNDKLKSKINVIKAGILASSPEEVKELSKRIIEEEVKNKSLAISLSELKKLVDQYDIKFNQLPRTAIELARYQRNRESLEKLYVLVEEKYQEALINEQSQPGNVLIIDVARRPVLPHKPNRILIILTGFILGAGMALGYVFLRNYFDNTVKSPEDIKSKNINVLTWIPRIEGIGFNGNSEYEFIVSRKPDSIPSEAFRALRTRIQYAKSKSEALKTILVSSSAPQEGKTTVSVNLAGAFAQSNKKTLIVDCDLRKPRIHSVFKAGKTPGVVDYLLGYSELSEIIRKTEITNLDYIPSGTIPSNPSEMLQSDQIDYFFRQMKDKYDIVIIDSAPVIAVTDTEILSRKVDGSILVVSSEITEIDMMQKAAEILTNDQSAFIGTVLNNFSYKWGYGSYYKYYYYYSRNDMGQHINPKKPIIKN